LSRQSVIEILQPTESGFFLLFFKARLLESLYVNEHALITVVGGGLAGVEAAWQIAQRGIKVCLYEMRPAKMTPAHTTDRLAELVCSNSLGTDQPDKAPGPVSYTHLTLPTTPYV
jgi:NADPH-dependent 2,4-dienoyl-CoA reductase/sulfur reductase-like enzyme